MESESNVPEEGMLNRLGKYKIAKVAKTSDVPVWQGIESERKWNKGGDLCQIGVSNGVGLSLKRVKKTQHMISRIPWHKARGYEYVTLIIMCFILKWLNEFHYIKLFNIILILSYSLEIIGKISVP